jgi:ATP-dependent exoDNAse (exonuclease V) alpha subunit
MALNPEQQELYDKVVSMDFSKMLLLGDAGTGKTFTLCSALSELVRRGNNNIILCAPTHLARLTILEKLDKDIRHLVETATVASLLSKFGILQEDGTTQFTSGSADKIDKYSLVALDEVSMISEQDYMLFMTSKAKIIFTGDYKQLPPVMARSAEGKMDRHTKSGNLEVMRLTQQMRQQGVIHAAAERNRDKAWFPEESEVGEGGESITVHKEVADLVREMTNSLLNDSRGYDGVHHYRYITYRNNTVRKIGKQVRDQVLEKYFGYNTSGLPFVTDEIIMMRENKNSIGYNGELVKVVGIRRDNRSHNYPWDSYELTLKGSLGTGMIRTIPPCQKDMFDEYMSKLQSKLRKYQISGELSQSKLVLSEIKRIKSQWSLTQYPFAITTHKSQGSTIENVYLDTASFVRAPNRRALLYVGISRASKSLHTVRIPPALQLSRTEVNVAYRSARAAYEDVTGESYRKVVRYLGVPTGSLEGKMIVTGYLESLVEDLKQNV